MTSLCRVIGVLGNQNIPFRIYSESKVSSAKHVYL